MAAQARAVLAVSPGGSLVGGRVSLLGGVGVPGGGSGWLVRGLPWRAGPTWIRGLAFPSCARSMGGADELRAGLGPGRLLGTGEAASLRCGLCGGALGVRRRVDQQLAYHLLAPSWAVRGGV